MVGVIEDRRCLEDIGASRTNRTVGGLPPCRTQKTLDVIIGNTEVLDDIFLH